MIVGFSKKRRHYDRKRQRTQDGRRKSVSTTISDLREHVLNELVWSRRPLNFLTRGKFQELIPIVDQAIEKSIERSLHCSNLYTERGSERLLYDALRAYAKLRWSESEVRMS